MTVSYQRYQ